MRMWFESPLYRSAENPYFTPMPRISYRKASGLGWVLAVLILSVPAHAGNDAPPSPPGNRTHITNVTFVAFDTETTGFDPVKDRVVEIGAVKFKDGNVIDRQSWLINPGREIPYWARRVHGITDDMVAEEPGFKEVYPKFQAFARGSILLAHNARFDIAFINAETQRNRLKPPPNDVIDTLPMFRKWFPESEKYSLEGLSGFLKIEDGGFHRALADSMYILWILDVGLERHPLKTLGSLKKSAGGQLRF